MDRAIHFLRCYFAQVLPLKHALSFLILSSMTQKHSVFAGYQFSFPFLSHDSGLSIEDGFYIRPLYKHLININRPTMAIIGLQICAYTYLYDMQVVFFESCARAVALNRNFISKVRLCLKYWSGEKKIPSKVEMLADTKREMDRQITKGYAKRQFHFLGVDQVGCQECVSSNQECSKGRFTFILLEGLFLSIG